MKGLLHILLFAGVVLFGFNTSRANFEGEDRKTPKKDSISGANKVLQDTVLKGSGVQVGDTLVFDDYDEDEPSKSADNKNGLATNDQFHPIDEYPMYVVDGVRSYGNKLQSLEQNEPAEIVESTEWQVYPNPASPYQGSEIWVEHQLIGQVQLSIIDQSGRVVQNFTLTNNKFSFQTPASGMYHLILTSSTQRLSKPLLVH